MNIDQPERVSEALRECPFCGKEQAKDGRFGVGVAATQGMDERGEYVEEGRQWSVICSGCGASCSLYCDSEAQAIAAWNRRAVAAPDVVEALREALTLAALNIEALAEMAAQGSEVREQAKEFAKDSRAALASPPAEAREENNGSLSPRDAAVAELVAALRPFANIKLSSIYADGEADGYTAYLDHSDGCDFRRPDVLRARQLVVAYQKSIGAATRGEANPNSPREQKGEKP